MTLTRTPNSLVLNNGNQTWTNMPSILTEFLGTVHRRMKFSFIDVDFIRLVARISTAGFAGSLIFAQYSTDESIWNTLTSSIAIDSTGTKVTSFNVMPVSAKGDVFIRLVGQGGNGTIDPIIGSVSLEFR